MTALAWLFGLGSLAIAFPFILHLVRNEPKSRTEFSSLMFLRPSPPKLTEKKKLENILLLLLRMLVIVLLAFAFMRPMFRTNQNELTQRTSGRDILIVIDSSASMNRNNIASQVVDELSSLLTSCESTDNLALCSYGTKPEWLVSFPSDVALKSQKTRLLQAAKKHQPGFGEFDLAGAISFASETLKTRNDQAEDIQKQQIVLITDRQRTSSLNGLTGVSWPDNQLLKIVPVKTGDTNATILNVSPNFEQADLLDVRVGNYGKTGPTNFEYEWQNSMAEDNVPLDPSKTNRFYLANEKTETLQLSKPTGLSRIGPFGSLALTNDVEDFDNTFYFAPPPIQHVHIVYFADEDIKDPNGVPFFLGPCFAGDVTRRVTFSKQFENTPPTSTFVVVSRNLQPAERQQIRQWQGQGTHILVLLNDTFTNEMQQWLGVTELTFNNSKKQQSITPNKERYALLVDVDFQHPVFQVFAKPGLNDFSDIRFWSSVSVTLTENTKMLARFDDQRPAIWVANPEPQEPDFDGVMSKSRVGKTLVVASDWRPDNSQLALSVKFPIFITELINWACPNQQTFDSLYVGQPIPVPTSTENCYIKTPTGERHLLNRDDLFYRDTNWPGIYQVTSGETTETYSVNIAPQESSTQRFDSSQLESAGIVLGLHDSESQQTSILQKKADIDFENRQKAWKWILCGTLLVLLLETILAARSTTPSSQKTEVPE